MTKIAELFSLFLSVPTIMLSLGVVVFWYSGAMDAIKRKQGLAAQDWFIVGVFIGFIGEALDNAYWMFAWTASFLGLPSESFWFENGAYPNIFFRQICGALAAYCHIRAHFEFKPGSSRMHDTIFWLAMTGGLVFAGALMFAR